MDFEWNGLNIIITGGAGFIGTNLTKYYLSQNYRVIILDNLITGTLSNFTEDELKNISFFECDITNFENTRQVFYKLGYLFESNRIKYVFHLASIASPIFYKKYPLETLEVGSSGTKNIFDLVRKYNEKTPILITSTSEVYGDPLIETQSEDYYGNVNCFGERSCYDESKRYMESLAYSYIKTFNMDIKIARLFNTYGEYMLHNDGRIIPNVINQCLNNLPISIYGDGKQTRSFCYISDTIDGMTKLMESGIVTPVNIGNPNTEYDMNTIAQIIKNKIGSNNEIFHMDIGQNDPRVRHPDITKATSLLYWQPSVDLDYGLEKTIEYFIKNNDKNAEK
jgi:dTDP-glucose 4,6-dehydratase